MSESNEADAVQDFESVIGKYASRHWPGDQSDLDSQPKPYVPSRRLIRLLVLVRLIPWALAALFILSFLWDFDQLGLQVSSSGILLTSAGDPVNRILNYTALNLPNFSYSVPLEGLLITMSASGLIGFFTNWLAITMLFHPRVRRPIFGQGVVPAQRDRVIHRLALAISDELVSEEVIKERIRDSGVVPRYRELAFQLTEGMLSDVEFRSDIKALAQKYVHDVLTSPRMKRQLTNLVMEKLDAFANRGLVGIALKAYRMVNRSGLEQQIEEAIADLPESIDFLMEECDRILDALPDKISARSEEIEQWLATAIMGFVASLDIYEMVSNNMHRYDERKLESLIKNSTNDQLNYIKYLGGALGLIGGLVIFDKWLAIPALLFLFGGLILLDMLLVWVGARRVSQ